MSAEQGQLSDPVTTNPATVIESYYKDGVGLPPIMGTVDPTMVVDEYDSPLPAFTLTPPPGFVDYAVASDAFVLSVIHTRCFKRGLY